MHFSFHLDGRKAPATDSNDGGDESNNYTGSFGYAERNDKDAPPTKTPQSSMQGVQCTGAGSFSVRHRHSRPASGKERTQSPILSSKSSVFEIFGFKINHIPRLVFPWVSTFDVEVNIRLSLSLSL